MTEQEIIALLDQVGKEMTDKFVKQYSSGRLGQLLAHLATCKMIVTHAHDEAAREETQERRDAVVQSMVLSGRQITDAQAAVERGER